MATAATAASTDHQIQDIPINLLHPSPTNPRKVFEVDELAASIATHKVFTPLLLRPHPKKSGHYEIAEGERRWRAGKIAKVETLPSIVRELSDEEVVEIQLLSFLQRSDLHPLEEADGYTTLQKRGLDAEQIAARVHKSTAHIRRRLQLTQLADKGRELFLSGKMTEEAAFLFARMPWREQQEEAIKTARAEHEVKEEIQPISGRLARRIIANDFMLALDKAPFPTGDGELVPAAGACTACPKRTGSQPELFGDVKDKDTCTDRKCFAGKRTAFAARRVAEAKEQGLKVLSDAESKQIFASYRPASPAHGSGFVRLDAEPGYTVVERLTGKPKTWKSALGKAEVEVIVGKDGTGAAVELVREKDAIKALERAGKLKKTEKTKRATASPKEREARAKERQAAEARELAVLTAIGKIADKARTANLDLDSAKAGPFWRWAAARLIDGDPYTAETLMGQRRTASDDGEEFSAFSLLEKTKSAADLRALFVELLVCEAAAAYGHRDGNPDDGFQTACRLFGVDWKETIASAKKELEAKSKSKKAPGNDVDEDEKPKKGGKS